MKVYQMLEVIKNLGEDDDIYCAFFTKDEADDMASEDLEEGFFFSSTAWEKIVNLMEGEEGIYQQLNEAFGEYVRQALTKGQK